MCATCKAQWAEVAKSTHPIQDGRWVEVLANIRFNATGEVRQYATSEILMDGETQPSTFNWSENNFSCDCNREIFFFRAAGQVAPERDCTDGQYAVRLENPVTGQVYYEEF
jgi:hypothetical protein